MAETVRRTRRQQVTAERNRYQWADRGPYAITQMLMTVAQINAPGPGGCCTTDTLDAKYATIRAMHAALGLEAPVLP